MDLGTLLPEAHLNKLVSDWLTADCPSFDYGAYIVGTTNSKSTILCKSKGVLCGIPFVDAIFQQLNCKVEWLYMEGDMLQPICTVATVSGRAKDLLQGERVALNVLARASGIATLCYEYNEIKENLKWKGEIAGTRKTTPGFRLVEKYALLVGKCSTHRYDLSSMVMLKDNHLWSVGNITNCVTKARSVCGFSTKIEVECRSVNEALEACKAGADVIMLDNFHASVVEYSSSQIKKQHPNILIELSGGVDLSNISSYMHDTIDIISTSTLTQGYHSMDYSMKIAKEGHDPKNPVVTVI